jgi:hypothetical protein
MAVQNSTNIDAIAAAVVLKIICLLLVVIYQFQTHTHKPMIIAQHVGGVKQYENVN